MNGNKENFKRNEDRKRGDRGGRVNKSVRELIRNKSFLKHIYMFEKWRKSIWNRNRGRKGKERKIRNPKADIHKCR